MENEAPQEAPQAEQEGQAPPQQEQVEQEAPRYDYDPDLVRSQYEEVKRREREVERREREWQQKIRESERQNRYPDPSMDMLDPGMRAVIERVDRIDRRITEREDREEKQREEERELQQVGKEAFSAFVIAARGHGMTREQAEKEWTAFTDVLTEHYPDAAMLRSMGVDRAVRNVFPLFRQTNGGRSQPLTTTTTRVTARTPIVTAQGTGPIEDRSDMGPQRQGESNTDYAQRVLRNFEALGPRGMSLRDGDKISSD